MRNQNRGYPQNQNKGHGIVESSMHGVATVIAAAAALVASGWIHQFTSAGIYELLLRSYGNADLAVLGMWLFSLLSSAFVFFLCRAVIVLAMMILATRFLVHFI